MNRFCEFTAGMVKKQKESSDNRKLAANGSITVFMAFIFILFFALTGIVLDSARFFSSGGYMSVSAYGAEIAVFGKYNRELYQDYRLFGYGGYDGLNQNDWEEDFEQTLQMNLTERPVQETKGLKGVFQKKYASVYQLGAISTKTEEVGFLGEEKYFMKQIDYWLKTTVVKDISEKLLSKLTGADYGKQEELLTSVEETGKVENKQIEQENKEKESKEKESMGQAEESIKSTEKSIKSEKNPLTFLKELMRDGILQLVCDTDHLSEASITSRREMESEDGETNKEDWSQKDTGTGILKSLLKQSDSLREEELLSSQEKKGKLLVYTSQMMRQYLSKEDSAVPYGLEYMVSGKENQKDAFAFVVNRLLLFRTLLNYAYVNSSPLLQKESLTTATAIAAPLAAEAFIPVIQQSILLILSLEEACVDLTALLEGKLVPIVKTQANFNMQYAEICMASKALFRQKASAYVSAEEGDGFQIVSEGIGYVHYLWFMLLMTSWEKLYSRTLDIIQNDLQKKYNQSFQIENCICKTRVNVFYGMPILSTVFLSGNPQKIKKNSNRFIMRQTEITYCYR